MPVCSAMSALRSLAAAEPGNAGDTTQALRTPRHLAIFARSVGVSRINWLRVGRIMARCL